MKLDNIVYKIIESIRHEISADISVDPREVKHDILTLRSRMLRTQLQKNNIASAATVQSLGCIEVEPVSASACCQGLAGCMLLRSVNKIPSTISLRDKSTITRIGPTNIMNSGYAIINFNQAQSSGSGRFNEAIIFAFILEGYVYLMQRKGTPEYKALASVNVMGIFNDPEEVAAFKDCDGDYCYTDEMDYPIEDWMLVAIERQIIDFYKKDESETGEDKSLDNDNKVIKADQ